MSDPNDLAAFLDEAWDHLTHGVADSRAPARYPTFATVSPTGMPEARTVALRGAVRATATLEIHTDVETPKVTALRKNPHAAFHIWIPDADLQIRMTTQVGILTGPAVSDQWTKVPPASRVSYGTEPFPGTAINHVFAYDKPADRDRFAVLHCRLVDMDVVHLGAQHRRAFYTAKGNWKGVWVAP